ncbi:MAG: hypothetical protein J7647_27850 [Cyanobacteria bacterium SBLK]|nr:hypothetical protein [Cyanobacteria bacterium SBLK]
MTTPETPNAIAVDPLLLQETVEAQQKLAHLLDRLASPISPEAIAKKTKQQQDQLIEEICTNLGSAGTFEQIDRLQNLQNAKSTFISHCFRVMLLQGLAWTEILQEISNRLPRDENNKETIDQLQELGNRLALTQTDFA